MKPYYQWEKFSTYKYKSRITELKEYNGSEEIILCCTQLPEEDYPKQKDRNRVVNEWIQFFKQNPTAIKRLDVACRVNQKLFDAICYQTNLEELIIKWGSYPDLKNIENLKKLKHLSLCANKQTKDLSPIGTLSQLETLRLENFIGTTDYSPLGHLYQLKQLEIHSPMYGVVKLDNLSFLENIKGLKHIKTTGFRLLNHDYTPILQLKELEYLSMNMPDYDYKIWNEIFVREFADIPYNAHRPYVEQYK